MRTRIGLGTWIGIAAMLLVGCPDAADDDDATAGDDDDATADDDDDATADDDDDDDATPGDDDDSGVGDDDDSAGEPVPVEPVEGVATDITLEVYSDGWGHLVDTLTLAQEGPIVLDVYEEFPYSDPPEYYAYARADGFYTELYYGLLGDTLDVDLDAVAVATRAVTGVVFTQQGFFADGYCAAQEMAMTGPGGFATTVTTDEQGRWGLGNLEEGSYDLDFEYFEMPFGFTVINGAGTDYQEYGFLEPMQGAAPNLYLYPEGELDVQVTLSFPSGGHVTVSEPEYGSGWDVHVEPDGTIDGTYGYLFYEAALPQDYDTSTGWILDGLALEDELRTLLTDLGHATNEIDDFVEYWVPELEGYPWYAVYPQDPEPLVQLHITPTPDDILRTLWVFHPLNYPISLVEPLPPVVFPREGFVAAEWGVLRRF
jgi:hypothetical protein